MPRHAWEKFFPSDDFKILPSILDSLARCKARLNKEAEPRGLTVLISPPSEAMGSWLYLSFSGPDHRRLWSLKLTGTLVTCIQSTFLEVHSHGNPGIVAGKPCRAGIRCPPEPDVQICHQKSFRHRPKKCLFQRQSYPILTKLQFPPGW